MSTLAPLVGRITLALHGVGWAVVYATVVGFTLGAAAWLALRLLDRRSAWVRYSVCGGALLLMVGSLVLAGSSVSRMYRGHDELVRGFAAQLMADGASDPTGPLPGGWHADALRSAVAAEHNGHWSYWVEGPSASLLGRALALLALAWLLGAASRLLVVAGGLRDAHRAAAERATRSAGERWEELLARAREDVGVRRRVRLRVSDDVDGPVLVGWLRPTILLPPAAHEALGDEDARAVLAHELAHVRRGDYLVNLVQMTAEAILFFHPVTWWLGSRLREEREFCSDELAHRSIGGPVSRYARAFQALEAFRARRSSPASAVPARGRPLFARMERLARQATRPAARIDVDAVLVATVLVWLWIPVVGIVNRTEAAGVALMQHELTLERDYHRIARNVEPMPLHDPQAFR